MAEYSYQFFCHYFEQSHGTAVEHSLNVGGIIYAKKDGYLHATTMGYHAKLNIIVGWVSVTYAFQRLSVFSYEVVLIKKKFVQFKLYFVLMGETVDNESSSILSSLLFTLISANSHFRGSVLCN